MSEPKIKPAKSVAAATKTARRGSTLTKREQEALAEDGRKALAAIELHTEELTRASRMTLASWLAYSRVLMTFRDSLPDDAADGPQFGQSKSNQAYGRWVRDNKLNLGPAKSASVRSNALWLARTWPEIEAVLQRLQYELSITHPTAIRRWWLSRQQAQERESRIFLDGLPREVNWPAETIHMAAGSVVYVAHRILREALITRGDVESLKANLAEVNAEVAKLLSYVADHPEVLSAEPHKLE